MRGNKTCWRIGPLEFDDEDEVPWGVEYGEYSFSDIDFTKYGIPGFTITVEMPLEVFSVTSDAEALQTTAVFEDWHHFAVTIKDDKTLTIYLNGRSASPYQGLDGRFRKSGFRSISGSFHSLYSF
ncbi:unnamed protein product [Vitrella brassicaformis CCMP3155]|uniref:LamG-like jellyroll fold domain-containing protein n=1 Tax=Vitrella brassicaformis (strain CCMP3155) TaxID=1169540 RepID=A0A0G4GUE4_VITBC|nr:unnamed protein product [Vitrella brassicaformis CCMP3155]|eukprot:CEM34179.1 unnamed protein product [Vitrella brassicaformis CCMP3155]